MHIVTAKIKPDAANAAQRKYKQQNYVNNRREYDMEFMTFTAHAYCEPHNWSVEIGYKRICCK